ncbi:MAG: hypothetical protein J0H48_09105 [Nitrosospira multiformis]|nr:hypothetical protein [Nitrosospira multiformis]
MTWKVDIYNKIGGHWLVEHSESQSTFKVKLEGEEPSKAQVRLIPPSGKVLPWTGAALEEIQEELQEAFEAEWDKEGRRTRLRELVQTKLDGDTRAAADVISRMSGRNVSSRSVQAWRSLSNQKSSRSCPPWALDALEAYVPLTPPSMVTFDQDRWLLENQVLLADQRLENKENWLKKWDKVPIAELGKRIASLDIFLTRYVHKLEDQLRVLTSTLETSESFEDYKTRITDELERLNANRFEGHAIAQAIRGGREEFSNSEAFPKAAEDDSHRSGQQQGRTVAYEREP